MNRKCKSCKLLEWIERANEKDEEELRFRKHLLQKWVEKQKKLRRML